MKNSKLIELLKSLTVAELKGFSVYLDKYLDKKDTLPQKLFFAIEKQLPAYDDKLIEKEKIYYKVFKQNNYNENKLSKLMSELTKLCENYIVYL